MRGKNKSFLEDTFILFVLGILIYGIYSFFFSSDEENQVNKNITTIEKKIEDPIIKEEANNEIKKDVAILQEEKNDEKLIIEQKVEIEPKAIEEVEKNNEILLKEEIKTQEIEPKIIEKIESSDADRKAKIELLYESIREKINKNIETTPISNGEYINIRITILKDGKYEQLTLMDGNKEYFDLIKPSIYKVFPVKMDDTLKENFPRYFRMKIEAK